MLGEHKVIVGMCFLAVFGLLGQFLPYFDAILGLIFSLIYAELGHFESNSALFFGQFDPNFAPKSRKTPFSFHFDGQVTKFNRFCHNMMFFKPPMVKLPRKIPGMTRESK